MSSLPWIHRRRRIAPKRPVRAPEEPLSWQRGLRRQLEGLGRGDPRRPPGRGHPGAEPPHPRRRPRPPPPGRPPQRSAAEAVAFTAAPAPVSRERLVEIISRAVTRTVNKHFEGVEAEQQRQIGAELNERIVDLLLGDEADADETAADAPGALAEPGEDAPPADAAPEHVDPVLAESFHGTFERLGLDGERLGTLRQRLVQLAVRAVVKERQSVLENLPPTSLRRIDLLERRIGKLRGSLSTAREAMSKLDGMEDLDLGVASIYRTVQGLAEVDALAEVKRDMLTEIFQANAALQGRKAD